ncbi:50S ribosomal protein L10 [bacterium]|nr:50S ribosomal protein L10 [bacterium]
MPTPEKEAVVTEVIKILESAKSVFITDFQGLNVKMISEFRQMCRETSVGYRVVKNTLIRLAAKKVGMNEMVDSLSGPSALAYSYEDSSAPARVISEFKKKADRPTIKVALFEGEFYGPESVQDIVALPSKSILLSQLLGGLRAPIQGLMSGLHGLLYKLVITLDEVKKVKEKSEK